MRQFLIIGTAHLDDSDLFGALEATLDQEEPDQLIVEIPDDAVLRGDLRHQKPDMVRAFRWALRRGTPVRGHEPAGPPILRGDLRPERAAELIAEMDRLVASLSVRATIDLFCARREPLAGAEEQLREVIDELVDPARAADRTTDMIDRIHDVAASNGKIMIICGGAHVPRIAGALPGARIVHGDYFF